MVLAALLCALTSCDKTMPPPARPPASSPEDAARAFYAARPLHERPVAFTGPPAGMADMDAETCGACHRAIYEEWRVSTHRRAWADDPQLMEELAKSRGEHDPEAGDVSWLCANCHTPIAAQQPRWVVALDGGQINRPVYVDNPGFDAGLQRDAVTCAACHVRDGVVYGPYGDTQAPHPVKKGEFLLTSEVCARCHQAVASYPAQVLGCFFETGSEWAASDAARQGQTCQSCHMPTIERHVADSFTDRPKRQTRRHWFGGSLIPKTPAMEAELAPLRAVYGSGVSVALARAERATCGAGPCVRLVIEVVNDQAGHHMPTGDPERHLEIVARARRPSGEVVGAGRAVIGSKYQWWPEVKLLSDNRIPAGGTYELVVEAVGIAAEEALEVEVEGRKWRMYEDAFEHHKLDGRAVRGRVFHQSRWAVRAGQAPERVALIDDKNPTK